MSTRAVVGFSKDMKELTDYTTVYYDGYPSTAIKSISLWAQAFGEKLKRKLSQSDYISLSFYISDDLRDFLRVLGHLARGEIGEPASGKTQWDSLDDARSNVDYVYIIDLKKQTIRYNQTVYGPIDKEVSIPTISAMQEKSHIIKLMFSKK